MYGGYCNPCCGGGFGSGYLLIWVIVIIFILFILFDHHHDIV
jgi:hypothetical protein